MERLDAKHAAIQIEKLRASINFPKLQPCDNINQIINECSNLNILSKLDPIRLSEYQVVLSHYALYLASETNKLEAKMKWCENNIQYIIGKQLHNVDGYFAEKQSIIRSNENTCVDLDAKKLDAQTQYEILKFLSEKIKFLCQSLETLVRTKISYRKQYEHS